ncbi:MAG TPA: molybdopterin-guanine dinucleotide biosynthesis protein B [Candidatus Aminicenantes bacterium]|nr:molybdopterin-guanine dinucleotide biosynthesis protein B [Candidatus Aminicenantes bacterium]HRY65959.1 molybdopterin-guanine dinucleotide biosynthesis protein B [Candidatus Aminicenantes bacterium]HRZ72992.1 molybdopterin-guanine dinucleotide biosynthesis protein B [Candidatus Aminicenantes bacterium]
MKIVAVVGCSETGKTRLGVRLIGELRRRGLRVSAVKRCSHGFTLDTEGKDSADFSAAGADNVALVSPEGWAALGRAPDVDASRLAARLFPEADVVLIEGGKDVRGTRKIEVLRTGVADIPVSPAGELAAVVTDGPPPAGCAAPVFGPDDIAAIADLIVSLEEGAMADIRLEVDGRELNLNPFVRTFIEKTVLGMVTSLSGVDPDPRRIRLVIDRTGDKPEGAPKP